MSKCLFIFTLLLSGVSAVSVAKDAANTRSDFAENLQKAPSKAADEPLFKDGKGYYSYKRPLNVTLPKDKVLIQYFYQYGCEICLNADDYLKHYAARHADKVVLERAPAFPNNNPFTAQMHSALVALGRPDLSEKYLFDSANTTVKEALVKDNEAIKSWLKAEKVAIDPFFKLYTSPQVQRDVSKWSVLYQTYSPPVSPIAVLNGKYILIRNTLYNDDYTYAVLDFLVEKLQQEQQERSQ